METICYKIKQSYNLFESMIIGTIMQQKDCSTTLCGVLNYRRYIKVIELFFDLLRHADLFLRHRKNIDFEKANENIIDIEYRFKQ